jgi:hypothetical protein
MRINENKSKPWECREHLATAGNIAKFEGICSKKHYACKKFSDRIKPRAQTHGKVNYIFKDGREVI